MAVSPRIDHHPASRERPARTRRRLARTLSLARWGEYRRLLSMALEHGYRVVSLETWLEEREQSDACDRAIGGGIAAEAGTAERAAAADTTGPAAVPAPVLILRHDVDQYPASALRMAAIGEELGVRSTWYFRWRTAQPRAIAAVRAAGHEIGLHYETLSRELLRRGLSAAAAPEFVPRARELLREELAAFAERHGPTRSACPHGDTRIPGVHNGVLLQGEDLASYGLRWESNAAVGRGPLDVWLTDRASAEGRWKDGLDPIDLLIDRRSPILAVVHPNNWVSGAALWGDRLAPGRIGTLRSDEPPLGSAQPALIPTSSRAR